MSNLLLDASMVISNTDYVAFTFFIGTMAMMAAAVFFFFEVGNTAPEWRTSVLVSGLITFIAAVHYYYMRGYSLETGESPIFFRYVDWILTVPLMCVEFYLITKKAGAKASLLWKLIFASVIMLVTGYWGEAVARDQAAFWGLVSGLAYFYIVYEVFAGDIAKLASSSNSASLGRAMFLLKIFITLGWSIYPIGYMVLPGNLLSGMFEVSSIDLFYNLADAINKIGFGLVVYSVAVAESSKK